MKKIIRILYDHPFLLFVMFVAIAYLPVLLPFFHLKNDLVTQNLPTRFVISESVYSGFFPWWNPYIYFGIPQYGDMNNGFWNPFIWIISKTIGYNIWSITLEEMGYILLGGWGLYKICREFFNKETAVLTGLSYMACGYTIGHLQHFCWITGTAFFPCVLLFFIRVHKNPVLKNFVLGGFAVFLFLAATHPGLIIGALYFFAFGVLFIFFNRKKYTTGIYGKKFWLINILFLLFGLLLSTVVIVSNLDVLQHISRGLKLSKEQQLLNPTTLQSYISLLVPLAVHKSGFFATDISMRNVYIGIAGLLGLAAFIKYYPKQIILPAVLTMTFFILLSSGGVFKIIFSKFLPLIGYVRMNGEFTYFVVLLMLLSGAAGFNRFLQIPDTKPFIQRLLFLLVIGFSTIAIISLVYILATGQYSGLQTISTAVDFKTTIKVLIDNLSFSYLLLIGSLLQLITVIALKKFIRTKPLAYSVLILNLFITTWLILPYTGVGMQSKRAVDKAIAVFAKGIHAPELRSLNNTVYIDSVSTSFLWMRSSYSKKIGYTPIELYPVQLRTSEVFTGDTGLVSFINKQSYIFLSEDTTVQAKTSFDSSVINVVSFAPGHVKITVRSDTYNYITLLQNNYPYWKVKVNSQDVPHFTGYKTFISAALPKGNNIVEFIFDPRTNPDRLMDKYLRNGFGTYYTASQKVEKQKIIYSIKSVALMKTILRNSWKNLKAICFGLLIGLVICEIVLRIYNPFPFSLKKGKLILPANQSKVFTNKWINKLDREIHYSRNSLGFRGPEPPDSISRLMSIITIGGSTTECKFQSDSSTWSFLLYEALKKDNPGIWLNNAGVDGHSTFGHLLLMNEYIMKIKPRYALFLTGINDEEIDQPDEFDRMTEKKITTNSLKGFVKSLLNHTELGRTVFNFYHVQVAYKKGLVHRDIDVKRLVERPLPDSIIHSRIVQQDKYLDSYRQRITQLLEKCVQAGIHPVLITQPSLLGDFTDSATQIQMGNKWVNDDNRSDNCMLEGKVLELYNDVLRSFSGKFDVIDLAREMPKSSIYYYDFIHFTNAGAKQVSAILLDHLGPIILNNTMK